MNQKIRTLIAKSIIFSIRGWQRTLSPDHAGGFSQFGRCRFYPSCSEYAVGAFRQYGLRFACVVSLGRILRCNPWSGGGYDPPGPGSGIANCRQKIRNLYVRKGER